MNYDQEYDAISEYYEKLAREVLTYVALMIISGLIGFAFGAAS